MIKYLLNLFTIFILLNSVGFAFENSKIKIKDFSINKYEITIKEFEDFTNKTNFITEAEKTGGGYEWGMGWEKKKNWNFKNPYGEIPESKLEPAVHISRYEAEKYCNFVGGRLPKFNEWKLAAYTQMLDSKRFEKGKTYPFPSGTIAENMNSKDLMKFNRHIDVTKLPEQINDLVAMGGNVWEWNSDEKNKESLTSGASWWYGSNKTTADQVQFKPSNFYAVYVGFRCAFDK